MQYKHLGQLLLLHLIALPAVSLHNNRPFESTLLLEITAGPMITSLNAFCSASSSLTELLLIFTLRFRFGANSSSFVACCFCLGGRLLETAFKFLGIFR